MLTMLIWFHDFFVPQKIKAPARVHHPYRGNEITAIRLPDPVPYFFMTVMVT